MTWSEKLSIILSIVSIAVSFLSVWLSVWFFLKSSDLSNKTNEALINIENSTKDLKRLNDNYIDEIFKLHKTTHTMMADRQLGEIKSGTGDETMDRK
jgi:hypothetical protein